MLRLRLNGERAARTLFKRAVGMKPGVMMCPDSRGRPRKMAQSIP